ncbi:sigma-70 family RNA polymerase sigma factor [bacterium]|nr:sigma-70 family RNA polymerase sigma factor [bacterium]
MFGKFSSISSASDEKLAELLLDGNSKAMEALFERYFDLLFRFAYGYVKSEAIAEDLVQETFITLPEALRNFDRSRRFKTWIMTLVANRCKNHLRDSKNRARILDGMEMKTSSNFSLDEKLDREAFRHEVKQIISKMSEKEQELYHLRFEMDLQIQEIAVTMNIPEGSVKSGIFYLLKKIKTPLKKISDEYRAIN